jgi:hypothetical protein
LNLFGDGLGDAVDPFQITRPLANRANARGEGKWRVQNKELGFGARPAEA